MRIEISEFELNLLNKRNAATEAATNEARLANVAAQAAQKVENEVRTAFMDIVSSLSASRGNKPGQYDGVRFGKEDDKCFLELIDPPAKE